MQKLSASEEISASHDARSKSEASTRWTRRYRGWIGIVLLALVSYAMSLAATAPASLLARVIRMPAAVTSLSGSVWHGQALLSGGHRARWSIMPLASLGHMALVVQWSLQGPGTRIVGNARLRGNRISVNDAEGRTSWKLVNAIAPGLPITCVAEARVTIEHAVLGPRLEHLSGNLRSGPGMCAATGNRAPQPVEVPPLVAIANASEEGSQLEVTTAADPAKPLARATLTPDNSLILTLLPAGAQRVPGMPASGETTLEIPL